MALHNHSLFQITYDNCYHDNVALSGPLWRKSDTAGFPLQWDNYMERLHPLCCWPKWSVKQTVHLPLSWDAMTFVWRQSNTAHISGSLDVTTMNIFLWWCPHALIINFVTIIWCYITAFARRIYFCTDVTDPVTTSLFICVSPQSDWHIINNTHSYDFSRRKPVSLLCFF